MLRLELTPKQAAARAIQGYLEADKFLIDYLRSGKPLTKELRNFIADILEGKIKKNRGRRTSALSVKVFEIVQKYQIRNSYELHKLIADNLGEGDPHWAAVERTAKELNISPSHVDKTIYPRMKTSSRKFQKNKER